MKAADATSKTSRVEIGHDNRTAIGRTTSRNCDATAVLASANIEIPIYSVARPRTATRSRCRRRTFSKDPSGIAAISFFV